MLVRVPLFIVRCISLWLLLAVISGCAGLAPRETRPLPGERAWSVPKECARRARGHERAGDLGKALYFWEIVARFEPGNRELSEKIRTLRETIRVKADEHYSKGVHYFQENDVQKARKEFLSVLLYDPEHERALDYVRTKLADKDYALYGTKRGDTPGAIAKRHYGEQSMAYLVAYFNDLDEQREIDDGSTLKLPVIERGSRKGPPHSEEMLEMARALYAAGEYQQGIPLAKGVLTHDPANKEATELLRASAYEAGRSLMREKRYVDALQAFKGLPQEYRDVRQIVQILEKNLQRQAEDHYKRGVSHYTAGELDKAIEEWAETLRLNPAHPKAAQDLKKASRLRDTLNGGQ
jgi:tetratricopeptide (TPR) repeat protein